LGIAHLAELRVGDCLTQINGFVCSRTPLSTLVDHINANHHLALTMTRPSTPSLATIQATYGSSRGSRVIYLSSDEEECWSGDEFGGLDDMFRDSENDDSGVDYQEEQQERYRRQTAAAALASRPPVATAAAAPRRAPIPYTPGEVIDLLSDDDEPARPSRGPSASLASTNVATGAQGGATAALQGSQMNRIATVPVSQSSSVRTPAAAPQRAQTAAPTTAQPTATAPVAASTGKRSLDAEVATTESTSGFKRRKVNCGGVEIKIEFEPKKFGEANIGDEVVEVLGEDETATGPLSASKSSSTLPADGVEVVKSATPAPSTVDADDDFEDFQIVGTTMQVASDMPHQRYSCTTHPFRMEPPLGMYGRSAETPAMLAERIRINQKHCANCYCYVCDCKVTECLEWLEHCHATHKEAKWKLEKDARNSKLLKLMSGAKRAAFFARYKDALAVNRVTGRLVHGTFLEADENEEAFLEADLAARRQSQALNAGAYPTGQVTKGKPGVARDLTKTVDLLALVRLKLHTSRLPLDRDRFLEASELLLRALTSMKHAGENPSQVGAAVVTWLFHPLCAADIRNVVRAELANAAPRNMVLGTPMYVGLRQLLELPEAALQSMRQPQPSTNSSALVVPPAVAGLSDQLQTVLIAELMAVGNFGMIKQLTQRRPGLAHSLMVLYIRNGSPASCAEAVDLACQANLQQKPFISLRASIQDVSTDKLLRFLGAGIAYNLRQQALKGTSQAGWSLSGDCTDMVFGLLLARACEQFDPVEQLPMGPDPQGICAEVDKFMSSAVANGLENVAGWLQSEHYDTPTRLTALLAYLFVFYSNWRIAQSVPSVPLNVTSLVSMLITQAVFSGLRLQSLIVLANSVRRYFIIPAHLDHHFAGGVSVGTVLACHIAQKALYMLASTAPLRLFDQPIRNTWIHLPELRKARPGEICTAKGPVRQLGQPSPAVAAGTLELRFCQAVRPADCALNMPNQASRAIAAESPRLVAHYCDVHYTYDTFLMALVAPKNVPETNIAQVCWSHSLTLNEAAQLVRQIDGVATGGIPEDDVTAERYVAFVVSNREVLQMVWKTVVRHLYCYMHAIFYMDNAPLAHLMGFLNTLLKPWVANVDVVSAATLSLHPACQGYSVEQVVELQAVDLTLRMLYHFSNLLSKYKDSTSSVLLPLQDLRAFKAAVMRLEAVGNNPALAARLCYMCLLEYPTVSTRAVWHSFWRRFLQSLISKRNSSAPGADEIVWETQATLLLLEDWLPLKDVVAKAAGMPRQVTSFIMAIAQLQKSDFSTMNYGAVSGMQTLKNALEPITGTKFTVPLAESQLQPLPMISEKCVELPESGLAHLVQQFSPEILQHGALEFQPYFAYSLRKRADSPHAQLVPNVEAALKLVMQAYEGCVQLVSSPGRNPNISYAKVLCACVAVGRLDLVQNLVAAGMPSILHPMLPANPQYASTRAKVISGALMMAHNQREFELLLVTLDPFVAEVYTDHSSVSKMAPVLKKFCPGEGSAISGTGSAESSWVKQLRFYHLYTSEAFFDYWSSIAAAEKPNATARLLAWTKKLEGTPRFRTEMHISILSQIMDRAAFAAYLSGPELDSPAYDKYQVMQALVKIVQVDAPSAVQLAPLLMRLLFGLTSFTSSMRTTLLTVCKPALLPPPAGTGDAADTAYGDARTLLLYLGDPDTHAEALGFVYGERYTLAQKQGLCHILLDRDRPEPFLKLLLKARDYPQLFWALRDVYYGANLHPLTAAGKAAPVAPIALALEKLKGSLTLANVYHPNSASVGGGNAGLSLFQKELFDDSSFVVCLAKFLLFLQAQHIDDKMVTYPAPLGAAIDNLLNYVGELAHGDIVVTSYLRLHVKFSLALATAFSTNCHNAHFPTVSYTPTERNNASIPSTLVADTVRSIAQAPKYYTLVLSMIPQLYQAPLGTLIAGTPLHSDVIRTALTSPCTYHRDNKQSFETASGGVLWIPRADSSGASAVCATELLKLLGTWGAGFSEILVGPIVQRLLGADPDSAELNTASLQQWSLCFTDELKRVALALHQTANAGFLVDLFELQKNFQLASLMVHADQALRGSYAVQYRKIVFKLAALAITSRATNMRHILTALTHEFHHPNNAFTTFFTTPELERLCDLIGASEDSKHDVRVALIAQGKVNPVPVKSLLRIPRVLTYLARDFANLNTYEHFAALSHAQWYAPLWMEVAAHGTEHSGLVFQQAVDCFRAIVNDCRSNTVNARTRATFEEVMQSFAQLFALFPDKGNELRALKQESKSVLKSKQALVKAMAVLS
jgi:hypothetical protein